MTEGNAPRRRGPDAVTLTAGVLALALALHVMIGGPVGALLWVVPVGAVAIGVAMLLASLRPRRER
ncbi:hypothetical protein [Saccharopolyspora taberi]|uniref:MYXO-CTERM domain-containing protein n=1 Tax=Saccharopolyspora taberi TaxID=60895 RepID=A0ABN3VIF9_9PSEU